MRSLEQEGIETRTFFYPIHAQPFYAKWYQEEKFPITDELSKKGINLPSGNNLTADEVIHVCKCIREHAR